MSMIFINFATLKFTSRQVCELTSCSLNCNYSSPKHNNIKH